MHSAASNPPSLPDSRTLTICFLRTYLVMSAFNTRGMQNIGLMAAMEPGLAAIHRDPAELVKARRRYLKHYNSHPFWTPLLVGLFLALERDIARGLLPAGTLEQVKKTTVYTLSAIGDSLFGGTAQATWALATACMLASGHRAAAVLFGAVLFVGLQLFKLTGFWLGWRDAFKVLPRLKKLDLINWGRRLKYVNALLLVLFWAIVWPGEIVWWSWLATVGLVTGAAWLVSRLLMFRELMVMLVLGVMAFWPWFVRAVAH